MSRKSRKSLISLFWWVPPLVGILFFLWYIRAAGADVVYGDYIRIVADYLTDVGDISRLFTPDVLTRVPASFLARLINVQNFDYSVSFDRVLGIAGVGLMALSLAFYIRKRDIDYRFGLVIYLVLFSLTKWEILLNGTAWTHLMSFGLFFVHYYLLELLWKGETSAWEELTLVAMPLLMLLVAGEYIASYAVTLLVISLFGMLMGGGGAGSRIEQRITRLFRALLGSTILALALYLVSRHFAVWEHAGMSDIGILELMREDPWFLQRFFFKSFTGAVIGIESAEGLPEIVLIGLGVLIFAAYLTSVYIYIRTELYEQTILPLILVISGFVNHVLITLARWRFLDSSYGCSSRYAAQYMVGLIGILIIFSLYTRQRRALRGMNATEKSLVRGIVIASLLCITLGNCYTDYCEIVKARYREANFEEMRDALLDYDEMDREDVAALLEWHKDTETLDEAVEILRSGRLNVFR